MLTGCTGADEDVPTIALAPWLCPGWLPAPVGVDPGIVSIDAAQGTRTPLLVRSPTVGSFDVGVGSLQKLAEFGVTVLASACQLVPQKDAHGNPLTTENTRKPDSTRPPVTCRARRRARPGFEKLGRKRRLPLALRGHQR